MLLKMKGPKDGVRQREEKIKTNNPEAVSIVWKSLWFLLITSLLSPVPRGKGM